MSSDSPQSTDPRNQHPAESTGGPSPHQPDTPQCEGTAPQPQAAAEPIWCWDRIERSGDAAYLHLIRAAEDPSRSSRPIGGRPDRAPHRTLDKASLEAVRCAVPRHLAGGVPRTFNRLTVELWDSTADIAFGMVADEALWSLVGEYLEHTTEVPILFRLLPHLRGDLDLRQGRISPAPGSQISLTLSV